MFEFYRYYNAYIYLDFVSLNVSNYNFLVNI